MMTDQIVDILEAVQRPQIARLQAENADLLARLDAERARGQALYEVFVKHRTATHEVRPMYCVTCKETDAAMAAYLTTSSTDAG